jgi:gamma-glutamyltranspeptidase/glutathione hydrolase
MKRLACIAALLLMAASARAEPPDSGFGRGERISGSPFSGRSPVIAPHGAAATAHPLATQVAIDVLKDGGSAVDAAIAANAMLGLLEPTGSGIGGDVFAIVWDPKTRKLWGYNGSGRSALGLSLEELRRVAAAKGNGHIPSFGAASVTVPGAVDGWFALHGRFGRLPMRRLLAPAIDYAENGAPVPQAIATSAALKRNSRPAGWRRSPTRAPPTGPTATRRPKAACSAILISPAPTARSPTTADAPTTTATCPSASTPTCAGSAAGCARKISAPTAASGSIRCASTTAPASRCANCRRTRKACRRCRCCKSCAATT